MNYLSPMRENLQGEKIIDFLRFVENSFKLNLDLPDEVLLETFRAFEQLSENLNWITSDYQLSEMTIIFLRDKRQEDFQNLDQTVLLKWLVPYQNSGLFTIRN